MFLIAPTFLMMYLHLIVNILKNLRSEIARYVPRREFLNSLFIQNTSIRNQNIMYCIIIMATYVRNGQFI